jgi:tetratricopeptide (TPR) repeat protein
MMLGALAVCTISLAVLAPVSAGDESFKKEIETLNLLTGLEPAQGMLQKLLDSPEQTKGLIQAALPLAKKKDGLTYNAALVLAVAAADQKNLKASDTFFHVCAAIAAREQSVSKLLDVYNRLVKIYLADRKYDDCIRICREVLALKTDDAKQRIVYRAYTDDRGDTDFNEYPSFDSARPLRPMFQRYLVVAMAKQGDVEQALKLADQHIKSSSDWRDMNTKASVLREAGRGEEAAKLQEEVIRRVERDRDLDPEDREDMVEGLRQELSNIYVELNQVDKAAKQLEILIKKKPSEPGYYNDLGYILADHDMRLDEAEQMIRKALDLDKARRQKSPDFDPKTDHDNGAYLDSLGWVLYKKKDLKEARKYLELAVEDKNTQHIEIYDHLGDVYLALGERDAAIRAWEDGLKYASESRRDQQLRTKVAKKLEEIKSKSAAK